MSGSTEKKIKDPKSNEESDDSPLNQSNRTGTETKTEDKSETKASSGPHGKETKFETSTKHKGSAGKGKDTKTVGGTENISNKTKESDIKQKEDSTSSSGKKTGRLSEKKTSKELHERSHSNAEQMKQKSSKDKNETEHQKRKENEKDKEKR
ncbi:hypothetical protein CDAR_411671 [Caerostris darwini]|uniref:Uncharacterized protein n=1 Tax=Caerostris darwini TaxID=1538125 RepID=A0AAV4MHW5_9ARAC|nr:hypothetical protein CDAR_411671 [Caerostris darwini]